MPTFSGPSDQPARGRASRRGPPPPQTARGLASTLDGLRVGSRLHWTACVRAHVYIGRPAGSHLHRTACGLKSTPGSSWAHIYIRQPVGSHLHWAARGLAGSHLHWTACGLTSTLSSLWAHIYIRQPMGLRLHQMARGSRLHRRAAGSHLLGADQAATARQLGGGGVEYETENRGHRGGGGMGGRGAAGRTEGGPRGPGRGASSARGELRRHREGGRPRHRVTLRGKGECPQGAGPPAAGSELPNDGSRGGPGQSGESFKTEPRNPPAGLRGGRTTGQPGPQSPGQAGLTAAGTRGLRPAAARTGALPTAMAAREGPRARKRAAPQHLARSREAERGTRLTCVQTLDPRSCLKLPKLSRSRDGDDPGRGSETTPVCQ